MVPLARRNLFQEKGRLAMSVAGVAFAVLLVLIIVSLYRGWSGVGRLFNDLPGELWVTQAGTSDPFRSSSFLPVGDAATLAQIPGVRRSSRSTPAGSRSADGYELDVFAMSLAVPDGLPVRARPGRRFLPAPGAVVIDHVLAREGRPRGRRPARRPRRDLVVSASSPAATRSSRSAS